MILFLAALGGLVALGWSAEKDHNQEASPVVPPAEEREIPRNLAVPPENPTTAAVPTVAGQDRQAVEEYESQLRRSIGAASVSLGSALLSPFYPPLLVVSVATGLYSARQIFKNGISSIVRDRKVTIDVMGMLWFAGAYVGGYFVVSSAGLIVYYAGEQLVGRTRDRSQHRLIDVFSQHSRTTWQLIDSIEVEVPVESVQVGDVIAVQAGQVIPLDGVIVEGNATVDQHMLTGEGQPAELGPGDPVLAATMVVAGRVQIEVEKTGAETTAAQIGEMLNNTASYQTTMASKGERLADQSALPTLAVALVALPLGGPQYAITILYSAIGYNIKITGPIAMLNFIRTAADHGILIKDGRSLELLGDVDTVVFDKTGTLTMEQPRITRIHTSTAVDADTVLMYAATAEHRLTHPIARAVLRAADEHGIEVTQIDHASYEVGYGLKVRVSDHLVLVGSQRYLDLEGIELPDSARGLVSSCQEQGHSLVMVAVDGELLGMLELEPTVRPEVRAVVQFLRSRGLDIAIISGDQERPTRELADTLGISTCFANTLPGEKAALVARLQSEGRKVCFVGDGINDSVALKSANVSVSLRGASTAAIDSAQIVLMDEGLRLLPFLFELGAAFDRNMKAGYAIAVGQGVVVMGGALLALFGILGGTLIWGVSLLGGLAIAQLPLRLKYPRLALASPENGTAAMESAETYASTAPRRPSTGAATAASTSAGTDR